MPIYLYKNDQTGEVREIFQSMTEKHEYYGEPNEDKVEWKRVFVVPNASVQSKLDPNSKESFVKYTENKKGTVGDVLNVSAEASAARAEKNGGVDPVKQEMYKKYSAENNGAIHVHQKREEAKKSLAKLGVDVD